MRDDYALYPELYDVVYEEYLDDIAFYVEEAERAHGPCLELGCGTGRILIPAATAGAEVTGIDASPPMIARLRRKVAALPDEVQGRIRVLDGDMRTFELPERFALIYAPFRAFLHLMTVQDQITTLENIRRHLLPDGRLVLNFFDPSLQAIVANTNEPSGALHRTGHEFVDPKTGNLLIEWATVHYRHLRQEIDHYFIYDELDRRGRVVNRLYRAIRMRYIFRYEFEHLLARCGFSVEALYGSFDRWPVVQEGGELIWIARREGA
jgi:SAM-dependent methyltransferase